MTAIAIIAAAGGCDAGADETSSAERRCLSENAARAASGASECDWPQAGRSPRRTNYNDGETILSPETVGGLVEAWATSIESDPPAQQPARPVVWRGAVFVTAGRTLESLEAATGAQRWRVAADWFSNAPAAGGGLVYTTNLDALFALDTDTGEERWRAPPPAFDYDVSAPLVAGDTVYVGARRLADPPQTEVYAVDTATSDPAWRYAGSGSIKARRPATADGLLYTANPSSEVLALNSGDGTVEWVHAFADGMVGSPAVSRGKVVVSWVQCCADRAQAVHALDAASGDLIWSADLACTLPLDFSPVIDGTRVYVACDAPGGGVEVLGMSLATGEIEMDVTLGEGALSGELSGANGVLYVGSTDGLLRALDASTGDELLAIELGSPQSQPAIAGGRLFVGAGSTVHAFGLPD